jgi:YD repeat-containing protein
MKTAFRSSQAKSILRLIILSLISNAKSQLNVSLCEFKISSFFVFSCILALITCARPALATRDLEHHYVTASACGWGQTYDESVSGCVLNGLIGVGISLGSPGGAGGSLGGGGSYQTTVSDYLSALKKNQKAPPCLRVGDPIDPGAGAKVDAITDFAMAGEMGLKFARYYMSRGVHGNAAGPGWTDNLDYELHSISLAAGSYVATFMRPDGSQIFFSQPTTSAYGTFLTGPFTEVGGGGLASLTYNGNGTYTLIDEDAQRYTWSEDTVTGAFPTNKGILSSIKDPSGIGWTITHPSSAVTVVTHTSGQHMTLTTTTTENGGGINSLTVTDPAGNDYIYQAEAQNSFTWNLVPLGLKSVSMPGSTPVTLQYTYEPFDPNGQYQFPKGLTEVDYNGTVHDRTTYDTNGNALSSSLADGTQKTSLVYNSNSTGAFVTITNPLGHVSVYQYNAKGLPVGVTGQASSLCAATLSQMTYDTNGFMQSQIDNNNNVSQYTYSATGQLQQKTEAAGTTVVRTSKYTWDPTPGTDRLLSITITGWSQISYTYNTQNRLATASVKNLSANGSANQVLTTRYEYDLYANGMVKTLSVIHPSYNDSNTDIYSYDSAGNLTTTVNGLGQITTASNYNGLGEPRHLVGSNGDVTDFTYDGRGLLMTKTTYPNGPAITWKYTYDKFGLPHSLSEPDGEVTTWNRNDSGVLQTITHNDKDGSSTESFQYDNNGDVLSDVVKRGSSVGISKGAFYDELGRLHQTVGNNGQSITYAYDGNGNVHSTTNAAGHVAIFAYDPLNRAKTITESGGASQVPPAGMPSLTIPSSSSTGTYSVTWTAVAGALNYNLQEQFNGGGWVSVQNTGATGWNVSSHGNGSYGYRVAACNVAGCGSWSSAATIVVAVVPTSAPTLTVPASNSTGAYSVSWSSVSYATSYTVQEQPNGGSWAAVYSGSAYGWSASGRAAGTYGYRVQACNINGCSGWSSIHVVTVSMAIGANGQTYIGVTALLNGQSGSANIGFDIAGGNTWEVVRVLSGGFHVKLATGPVPPAAVTAQFSWTFTGVPAGYTDGHGSVSNGAAAPTAISSNPSSQYTTASYSGTTTEVGRTYQVGVDFFNATGSKISSSTCTLTAELEGSP